MLGYTFQRDNNQVLFYIYGKRSMQESPSIAYRGFISATSSAMIDSPPNESENPWGGSDVAALFVTPLGHSLVVTN